MLQLDITHSETLKQFGHDDFLQLLDLDRVDRCRCPGILVPFVETLLHLYTTFRQVHITIQPLRR